MIQALSRASLHQQRTPHLGILKTAATLSMGHADQVQFGAEPAKKPTHKVLRVPLDEQGRPVLNVKLKQRKGWQRFLHPVTTLMLALGIGGMGAYNYQNDAHRTAQMDTMKAQVVALDGKTSAMSGLSRDRLDALARQVTDLQGRTTAMAERPDLMSLVNVVERVTPSTVQVKGSQGLGSGVFIRDNSGRMYILTNSHVTEDNGIIRPGQTSEVYQITLYTGRGDQQRPVVFDAAPVMLANGQRAASPSTHHDLALLAIPADVQLPAGVVPVMMRDVRETLRAGEVTVAVGSPLGLKDTVTSGIISHTDRQFGLEPHNRFIQMDTPINPGNSGGGLFDLNGRLIGINTVGYRGANNLAGSIRIDVIKAVLDSWGVHTMTPAEKAANTFQVVPPPAP